jgi:hypothetical protein
MRPNNLGGAGMRVGLLGTQMGRGGAMPGWQTPGINPNAPQPNGGQSVDPRQEARAYGIAEALGQPIEIQSGGWGEALAEGLAGGLRGRAAQNMYAAELERNAATTAREGQSQDLEDQQRRAQIEALQREAQPEQWSDPYELGGAQVQRNERTRRVEPVITPMQLPPTWGQPYDLNGTQVQENSRGQIQTIGSTAVDPLTRAQAQADVERVTQMQASADTAGRTASALNRFVDLNQQEPGTGPNSLGSIAPFFRNSQSQQMAAITADLTPEQREPGSGATSNFDASMFMQALPGLDKSPAANRAISQAHGVRAQLEAQRAQVARAWLETGSLNGFDAAWSRYAQANPIFDPQSTPDDPRINPNRQDFMAWAQANGIQLGTSGSQQLGGQGGEQTPAPGGGNVVRYDADGRRIP